MDNNTLILWAIVIIILWVCWIVYLVIRKLKADAFISGGDVIEYFRR